MIDSSDIIRFPAILFCLTIHEYAHGYMALRMGDHTAEYEGRLTLNPVSHLDIFGTIMLLFGPFGWAKPVPVNPYNFRNPRKDMIKVAFAGPAINLIAAMLVGLLLRMLDYLPPFAYEQQIGSFLVVTMMINLGLAFFNLLPVPPLDGSNILLGFMKPEQVIKYQKIMVRVPMIFLALIAAEWMFKIPIFSMLMYPLWTPFKNFFQFLIFQRILF